TFFDVRNGDTAQLAKNLDWEQKYMTPFRAASIERVRRELPSVEIVKVPGTHKDFVFTSREQVVSAMQCFLGGTKKGLGRVRFARKLATRGFADLIRQPFRCLTWLA